MTRPRLLDLFCGAGGAAMGYHRAGFDVVGIDNRAQPHYPFQFVQADAMTYPLGGYDVVHASPPCQDHSSMRNRTHVNHQTGWMLRATRERFQEIDVPWVIENVSTAPMPGALVLCGASFGLGYGGRVLRRHRRFESNVFLMAPPCACTGRIVGVYGTGGDSTRRTPGGGGVKVSGAKAAHALGIDWTTRTAELSQAIPPAYTELIGEQLLLHLDAEPEQGQSHG